MSRFTSLLPWDRASPKAVDLSAESSGYPVNTDSLHSDPRRHRFSVPPQMKRGQSQMPYGGIVGPEASLSPRIKFEEQRRPQVSLRLPSPISGKLLAASASESAGDSAKLATLLDNLRGEVAGLLSQHLPGHDHADLLTLICSLSKQPFTHAQATVPNLLKEEPLGTTTRHQLVEAILARVLNYQMNIVPETQYIPSQISPASAIRSVPSAIPATIVETGFSTHDIKMNTQKFSSLTSKGSFRFFTTTSDNTIGKPPTTPIAPVPGDLFIHINTQERPETRQVWLYKRNKWEDISEHWNKRHMVVHPTIGERVLTVRADHTPNWILKSTAEGKARERAKSQPL